MSCGFFSAQSERIDRNGRWSTPFWHHFGVGAPPILVYFKGWRVNTNGIPFWLVGEFSAHVTYFSGWIGMFTGGTIWVLTHSQMATFGFHFLGREPMGKVAPFR